MKKTEICFLVILLISILSMGCSSAKQENEIPEKAVPFSNAEWTYYNEQTGEKEVLFFGEDNSFSYQSENGIMIEGYEDFEGYGYDEGNLEIHLFNKDKSKRNILKVLSYNVNHLLLELDGVIRDYTIVDLDFSSGFWREAAASYLSGYEMNRTIVELKENSVITAAVNYDTETDVPKGTQEEYKLAEDVTYFDLTVYSEIKVKDGAAVSETYDTAFTEITADDIRSYLDNGGFTCYFWMNDQMEIEKVAAFGMNTVMETVR